MKSRDKLLPFKGFVSRRSIEDCKKDNSLVLAQPIDKCFTTFGRDRLLVNGLRVLHPALTIPIPLSKLMTEINNNKEFVVVSRKRGPDLRKP